MKILSAAFVAILLTAFSARGADDIDVGLIDQKPPAKKELEAPKGDVKVAEVGLNETVKGKVAKDEKKHLYIVINPLGIPNSWWVQHEVSRDGESFSAESQFGEADAGKGELFAILAVATDKKWSVGEKLESLPENALYTKVKMVKRK